MTNWWVLSAIATELVGATLLARGLSLETPATWVRGRGTPRWDFEPDADLNYARSSTDAGTGFAVLVIGFLLQGVGAIDSGSGGGLALMLMPVTAAAIGPAIAARWRRRREIRVMHSRIDKAVAQRESKPREWATIPGAYSAALDHTRRPRQVGEGAWKHLDRVYGEGRWIPEEALADLRRAYETYPRVTGRDELGELWLPWFVRRDDPSEPIRSLERSDARQLRVRDVVDDEAVRPALELEYEDQPSGKRWTHLGRIADYVEQWRGQPRISQGPWPAFRTPEGPVLRDGCHRACALYVLGPPGWRITLELSDPPPGHADAAAGPRDGTP